MKELPSPEMEEVVGGERQLSFGRIAFGQWRDGGGRWIQASADREGQAAALKDDTHFTGEENEAHTSKGTHLLNWGAGTQVSLAPKPVPVLLPYAGEHQPPCPAPHVWQWGLRREAQLCPGWLPCLQA